MHKLMSFSNNWFRFDFQDLYVKKLTCFVNTMLIENKMVHLKYIKSILFNFQKCINKPKLHENVFKI